MPSGPHLEIAVLAYLALPTVYMAWNLVIAKIKGRW